MANPERLMTYKGQTIILDHNPRIGVCNLCRAISGEVDAQRDKIYDKRHALHHEQYDNNDILAHTMEVCAACHRAIENQKEVSRFGMWHKNERRIETLWIKRQTKEKLKQLGTSGNDNDDVIFTLIEFWEEKH